MSMSLAELRLGKISGGSCRSKYQLSVRQTHESVIGQLVRPEITSLASVSMLVRTSARAAFFVRSRPTTSARITGMEDPDKNRSFFSGRDRKSTRLNSSHSQISYAVFCLKKKK